jgi:cytochrome P450
MPGAIEELLGYTAITPFVGRVAREPVDLGGERIEQGQFVIFVIGGANRDPGVFDDPERLDLLRTENRHLAFGMGMHYCLGASLARTEGAIAFETLLRRWPRLRLAPSPPVWQANVGLRGLASSPVVFDGAPGPPVTERVWPFVHLGRTSVPERAQKEARAIRTSAWPGMCS